MKTLAAPRHHIAMRDALRHGVDGLAGIVRVAAFAGRPANLPSSRLGAVF